MLALYQVLRILSHIVTQIVEAELIVGTKGDVGQISLSALCTVGTMLVDAVHTESVEHIDGTHPFGVTLGQIVIHGHHMDAIARKSIQEDRQGGSKSLTLTSEHLGYLTLMQHCASKDLDIEVHHIPLHVISAGYPMVMVYGLVAIYFHKVMSGGQVAVEICCGDHYFFIMCEALGSTLDDGKHLGTGLIECLLQCIQHILLQLVYLLEDGCAVLYGCTWNAVLQLLYLLAKRCSRILDAFSNLLHPCTEFVIGQCLHRGICLNDHVHQWLVCLQVSRLLVSKYLGQYIYEIHVSKRESKW